MKAYFEMKDEILNRLEELSKQSYPQFRSYRTADGKWVDKEPVPEYLEEQSLICRWSELHDYELALAGGREQNDLLIEQRLWMLVDSIENIQPSYDPILLFRIAVSVYFNRPID